MTENYEIRKGKHAPCELWSIVCKKGRTYENFVADGTHAHCQKIKSKLEAIKDKE